MGISSVGSVSQGVNFDAGGGEQQGSTHTVQRGDTLSGIAKDHGVSLSSLIEANPQIANPDLIYPDQVVHLPEGAGNGAAAANDSHATDHAQAATATLAASPAAATPVLRNGSSGEAVSDLQTQLRDAGFNPGPVDGHFGSKTEAAVRQFQTAQGIGVDGIVGPQTWGKLEAGANTPRLERGAEGPAVTDLQNKLKAAGVDPGPVDGQFGSRTEAAVREYQSSRGIAADGVVGAQTWGKLNSGAGPVERPPTNPTPTNPGEVAQVSDRVSNQRIANLHPEIQAEAAAFINQVEAELGITLRVTSGYRSIAEQNDLYAQGRTAPGDIVTQVRGGHSYHNYGLALDVVEVNPNGSINWNTDWAAIGRVGERLGFEWGGSWSGFVDRPHFQMDFGLSTSQLLNRLNNGQTTNGFVNVH